MLIVCVYFKFHNTVYTYQLDLLTYTFPDDRPVGLMDWLQKKCLLHTPDQQNLMFPIVDGATQDNVNASKFKFNSIGHHKFISVFIMLNCLLAFVKFPRS